MKRGIGFTLAWLGATIVAIIVAAAAVGSVRSQVTDAPTALGSPSAVALAADVPGSVIDETPSTASETTSTTSVVEPSTTVTTTTVPVTTTTLVTSDSTPTTTIAASPTTTTTQPPATTTTTTTAPSASYSKTYDTDGGSVRVIVDGESVTFGGAFPKTGWSVELEKDGPEEVKVKFERNDDSAEVQFKAHVESGELRVEISDEDGGDDEDDD